MMTALVIASGYSDWLGVEPEQATEILVQFIHDRAGAVDDGANGQPSQGHPPSEPSTAPMQKSVIVVLSKAEGREANSDVANLIDSYRQKYGITAPAHTPAEHDPSTAIRIADAYEAMKHDPQNPQVKAAYDALKRETLQQYNHAIANGYKFTPHLDNDREPYANSAEMMTDARDNKHLLYYPTRVAFGDNSNEPQDNPLLESTGIKHGSHDVLYNDAFRAIHDLYGHAAHGYQFGAKGEENAWRAHSSMFSPLANSALTSETRGQNSWVNFGKHLRNAEGQVPRKGQEGYVPPTQRPFAEQKTGLLPPEFHSPQSALVAKSLEDPDDDDADDDDDDAQEHFRAHWMRNAHRAGVNNEQEDDNGDDD